MVLDLAGKLEETILKTLKTIQLLSTKPMNITELSQHLRQSYPATLNLIDALERTGLIKKEVNPGPPRQIIIKLTKLSQCLAKCLNESD